MLLITDANTECVEPHHPTRLLRGIEIDVSIYDLIEFLWDHDIETMRSCENMDGMIYIAFRTVCDAVQAGLLTANTFALRVATNNVDGGYASTALSIPIGCVTYPLVENSDGKLCKYARKVLSPVLKDLTRTNLVKRMCDEADADDSKIATVTVGVLGILDATTLYVSNVDGKVTTKLFGGIDKSRSVAELLSIEESARTKYLASKRGSQSI